MKVNPDPENNGVVIRMSQIELIGLMSTIKLFNLDFYTVIRELRIAILDYYDSFPKV